MKTCPKCGTEYEDSVRFCAKCGTALPDAPEEILQVEESVPEPEKKAAAPKTVFGMPIAKLAVLAAAALAVIALLIIFIPKLFAGGGSAGVKDVVMAEADGEKWFGFSKSGKVVTQNNEAKMTNASLSADGKLYIFLTNEKELWSFNGSSYKKIAEDVASYKMAPTGNGIAYTDEENTLYLYNGSKSQKVYEEITNFSCISPDGKAVAFTVKGEESTKAYLYNGKVQEMGKDISPVALSDGGKYVYLQRKTSDNTAYYVQKGTDSDTRQKLGDSFKGAIYNTSGTQVIYYDGNKSYFCENAGERQSISSNRLYALLPENSYVSQSSYVYSNLKNQFYEYSGDNGSNIALLTSKLELESRMKNVSDAQLQKDGKTLVYVKNDNLYSANISKSSPEGTKLVDSVYDFVVSLDGKTVLYLDEDRVTYTVKTSGGKASKVSEDSFSDAVACGSGFLYVMDDELYFTTGGKGSKVSGLSDDVLGLMDMPLYTLIRCKDGSYFLTTNGKSVKKIYSEN